MYDYVYDQTLKNVWCSPDQDKQFVFKPARVSRADGSRNTVRVMWDEIDLPTPNSRYHVYQVGQIHPILIGISNDYYSWHSNPTSPSGSEEYSGRDVWIPFSELCNRNNLVVDLYINSGIQLPRFTSYLMVTEDKNILIAVKVQPKIEPHLNQKDFYIRLYSNAFFNSVRSNNYPHEIYVEGTVITTTAQRTTFRNNMIAHAQVRGQIFLFVNGVFTYDINALTVNIGDIVEYYYDSTVERVIDIPLTTMGTFDSILDIKRKYLLTYPETNLDDTIDFYDDIDFYLIKNIDVNFPDRYQGCYYHKNWQDSVRQLTHKDYSIPVPYVEGFKDDNNTIFTSLSEMVVRLYVRLSGYDRPLMDENNRIKELYKLHPDQVEGAMIGINATLSNWRAETLENSDYTRIMRSKAIDIDKQMIQNAYGYNALAKLIGNTPQLITNEDNIRHAKLPVGLQVNSTVFEFDTNGLLLGYHLQSSGENYFPTDPDCTMVEVVSGLPDTQLDCVFGQQQMNLSPNLGYRMYKTRIIANVIRDDLWEDVTGTNDYVIVNNHLTWTVDMNMYYVCVKSDAKILVYDITSDTTDHLITFDIQDVETRNNVTDLVNMVIPPGQIDIWMNQNNLIENLDYFVQWPKVTICNKQYLNQNTNQQNITVRATGFCRPDMTRDLTAEYGFVINGVLSKNSIFDVRDDRVLQMIAEGKLFLRDQLQFSEDSPNIILHNVRNGAPYQIKDIVVPLKDVTIADTYTLRQASQTIDKNVSDYLTQFVGDPTDNNVNIIPYLHTLFSPFCSKIIYDLINNVLVLPGIHGHYSEMDIRGWLGGYEWLLDFDPCRQNVDLRYSIIHPHPLYTTLTLDIYQYTFMERVISFYLSSKMDLTNFVQVELL